MSETPGHPMTTQPLDSERYDIRAIYRLQPDGTKYGKHMPTLDCSCGFWTQQCDDWEEAGVQMDVHVGIVRSEEPTDDPT